MASSKKKNKKTAAEKAAATPVEDKTEDPKVDDIPEELPVEKTEEEIKTEDLPEPEPEVETKIETPPDEKVEEAIPVTEKVETRAEAGKDKTSWVTIRAIKTGRSIIGVLTFDLVEGQIKKVPKEAADILVNGKRAVRMNIG